ncbi:MAG: low affinity iron permease family protein [Flavobacterium sp.]|nr:low affinity iron permease family protein [Pedobacter sp.]
MALNKKSHFESFANRITLFAGSSIAFGGALLIIILWGITGPLFSYSETWQLVINTGTTIITFLMVFLIQKSQNKESKAIQLKLNELIAASNSASNRMVDIEDLSEEEMDKLHKFYAKLSKLAEKGNDIHKSHSIDAAEKLDQIKKEKTNQKLAILSKNQDKIENIKKPVSSRIKGHKNPNTKSSESNNAD